MKIDDFVNELEQIKEKHGNIEIGIQYEMIAEYPVWITEFFAVVDDRVDEADIVCALMFE